MTPIPKPEAERCGKCCECAHWEETHWSKRHAAKMAELGGVSTCRVGGCSEFRDKVDIEGDVQSIEIAADFGCVLFQPAPPAVPVAEETDGE